MFNSSIFPSLSALPLAGKPMRPRKRALPAPTLSRRELQRLIADMID
jgi:hypothetical protein